MNEFEEFADSLPRSSVRRLQSLLRMMNDDVSAEERHAIRLMLAQFPAILRERMEVAEARTHATMREDKVDAIDPEKVKEIRAAFRERLKGLEARAIASMQEGKRDDNRLGIGTESEVAERFREMFRKGELSEEMFDAAELLLDELRPESPLRHRLSMELAEKRHMWVVRQH